MNESDLSHHLGIYNMGVYSCDGLQQSGYILFWIQVLLVFNPFGTDNQKYETA